MAKPVQRHFKICLLGEAKTGKSLLIDFLKKERTRDSAYDDEDNIFSGSIQAELANNYQPTWGLKCHLITQEITDAVVANLQVYESGAHFLSRFPHYMTYLAEEADLIIYTVGVDMETEATTRPV